MNGEPHHNPVPLLLQYELYEKKLPESHLNPRSCSGLPSSGLLLLHFYRGMRHITQDNHFGFVAVEHVGNAVAVSHQQVIEGAEYAYLDNGTPLAVADPDFRYVRQVQQVGPVQVHYGINVYLSHS